MRTRTKNCIGCAAEFTYRVGRGTDRDYCSASCVAKALAERRRAHTRQCAACPKRNTRIVGNGLCSACYTQKWRTGSTDRKRRTVRAVRRDGYVRVLAAGHPLADTHGWVVEHSMVLFDICQGADPQCAWCGGTMAR